MRQVFDLPSREIPDKTVFAQVANSVAHLMNHNSSSSHDEATQMTVTREQQLRATLKRLSAIHSAEMALLEESISILQSELTLLSVPSQSLSRSESRSGDTLPMIDRDAMTVVFGGDRCFLGNTLMLKFLERLARRPNNYISYNVLLADVWHGIREPASVRSVVKELRAKLRSAGMSRLAEAIDGKVSGHYGLMLDRIR